MLDVGDFSLRLQRWRLAARDKGLDQTASKGWTFVSVKDDGKANLLSMGMNCNATVR